MFTGNATMGCDSSLSQDQVQAILERELETLGMVTFNGTGSNFEISGSRFSRFGFDVTGTGSVSARDGRVMLTADVTAKPNPLGWRIAVCLFPIGCLIFLGPSNAKNDVLRKVEAAFSETKAREVV